MNLTIDKFQKSQQVRLLDIFVLTPALLWVASRQKGQLERSILISTALLTAAYNYRNYTRVCGETRRVAGELAELGEKPSWDRSRLVEPSDFESFIGCEFLT